MRFLLSLGLVFVLSGCVATQRHVEKGDELLYDLAYEFALENPGNMKAESIARRAEAHAAEDAGIDFGGILQQVGALVPGGWPALLAMLLGGAGVVSPGLNRKKKPPEQSQTKSA